MRDKGTVRIYSERHRDGSFVLTVIKIFPINEMKVLVIPIFI